MTRRVALAMAELRTALREDERLPEDLRAEAMVGLLYVSAALGRSDLRALPQREVQRASEVFQAQTIGDPTR